MPEIRYTKVYRDGKLVGREPYEVSDDELERESAEQVIRELSARADNEVTMLEIARFVKALARIK